MSHQKLFDKNLSLSWSEEKAWCSGSEKVNWLRTKVLQDFANHRAFWLLDRSSCVLRAKRLCRLIIDEYPLVLENGKTGKHHAYIVYSQNIFHRLLLQMLAAELSTNKNWCNFVLNGKEKSTHYCFKWKNPPVSSLAVSISRYPLSYITH